MINNLKTRKSSCVNARGIPTAAYQVLPEGGYPPPGQVQWGGYLRPEVEYPQSGGYPQPGLTGVSEVGYPQQRVPL